jgi:hypothetical protein
MGGISLMRHPQLGETGFQIRKQSVNINSTHSRHKRAQIRPAGSTHAQSSSKIAAFKVEQSDCSLDQSLKERLLLARELPPEILEHIMALKEFAVIEQPNAKINPRVIEITGQHRGVTNERDRKTNEGCDRASGMNTSHFTTLVLPGDSTRKGFEQGAGDESAAAGDTTGQ